MTIVLLVVMEDHRDHLGEGLYTGQNPGSHNRMEPHLVKLCLGKAAVLAQCAVADAELADVVQQAGNRQEIHSVNGEPQATAEHPSEPRDTLRVIASIPVKRPQCLKERLYSWQAGFIQIAKTINQALMGS